MKNEEGRWMEREADQLLDLSDGPMMGSCCAM